MSTSSSSSSSSVSSSRSTDTLPNPPVESELIAKIVFVAAIILMIAPCGLVMMSGGFPYAVTCLTIGVVFMVFSSYFLCRKQN